jgi:hypothetical protein
MARGAVEVDAVDEAGQGWNSGPIAQDDRSYFPRRKKLSKAKILGESPAV